MQERDCEKLMAIQSHCEDIYTFVQEFGDSEGIFSTHRSYQNAVCMSLMQIGETVNRLSIEFRNETKDQMPWDRIRGMRNMIAHEYASISLQTAWNTVREDIPNLHSFCKEHMLEYDRSKKQAIEPEIKHGWNKDIDETISF